MILQIIYGMFCPSNPHAAVIQEKALFRQANLASPYGEPLSSRQQAGGYPVEFSMSETIPETIGRYETVKGYISEVSATLERLPIERITKVVELLGEVCWKGKSVFTFGNGGSAMTASHFAADLSKGAISNGKPRIKAFALTDNVALLSAWANGTAYEKVFAEQLENLVEFGDIAIIVPSYNMEQVEDIHLLCEHVITTCLRVGP